MRHIPSNSTKWRKYQAELQRTARLNHFLKKLPLLILISMGAVGLLMAVVWASLKISEPWGQPDQKPPAPLEKEPEAPSPKISRHDLPGLLDEISRDSAMLSDVLVCQKDGQQYTVRTTIDLKLQEYIEGMLQRSRTLQSAVVVLNSIDGRVIAMVDHDSNGNRANLNLKADYPAASLFKIVSAAAVLENSNYSPNTALYFRGRRHTLYKSQLKQVKDRWTTETTLRRAFALSNNSVFGKLGIFELGQGVLTEYAEKFAFNRTIPFDLNLAMSSVSVPVDKFGLAEIASGFNKKTLISPLHAALLASVVVNKGRMPTPWLVDNIQDETGQVLYHADTAVFSQPVSSETAAELASLMKYAAQSGTSRSAFRKLRRKKLFKQFELGAKTGTINDKLDRFKYDWVTAFALTPDGKSGITVGVLGVHGKILGTRSTEMVRAIIDYYFRS
jgi:cell division protein FtsI/penicillin-binding protein 2